MKPLILCAECRTEIRWGERFCHHCGRPIDWSDTDLPPDTAAPSPRRSPAQERASSVSWKFIAGLAAVVLSGAIVLEVLTGTANIPVPAPQAPSRPAANMEAAGHLNELESQVKADPSDEKLRLHLANSAHDNRFYDKAIEHYKEYLRLKPGDPDALVDLGICYNDIGDYDEARTHMNEALKKSPQHLLAHFNLGIVNLKAGDLARANEWFRKALSLSPDSEVGKRAKQLLEQHETMSNVQ